MSDTPKTLADVVARLESFVEGEALAEEALKTLPLEVEAHMRGQFVGRRDALALLRPLLDAPALPCEDTALLDALDSVDAEWWQLDVQNTGVALQVWHDERGKFVTAEQVDDTRDLRVFLRALAAAQKEREGE